jgi:hypothetical protein
LNVKSQRFLCNNCKLVQFSQTLNACADGLGAGLDILSTLVDEVMNILGHLAHLLLNGAN